MLRKSSIFLWKYSNKPVSIAVHSLSTVSRDVNDKQNYDIIIAGGGMVGCTMACSLAKNSVLSNLKILLLEGGPDKKYETKSTYSNRVVALNQNTKSLMNSMNIWQHVEDVRLRPVRYMQVWDACSDAMITFSSNEILDKDVAYIVENDVLMHAISKELLAVDKNQLDIVYNAKINNYELSNDQENVVKMEDGNVYTCKLLIGADGANSMVRKTMGVQYLSWNYDQMGVVATVKLAEQSDNTTAWQRFLPSGPIALLPLDSEHSSLVWSTSTEHAKQLLTVPNEQFVDALNDGLWKQYPRSNTVDTCMSWLSSALKLGGYPDGSVRQLPPSICDIVDKSRAAFPLGFGHSTRYVAPGVALIGDAAHRVHPLAGQGVNLGFGDVQQLTKDLTEAVYSGLDITNESWLKNYETERQRHNVPTQLAIDALHRLYTVDFLPFVLVRSIGLQLTNALDPVKKLIMSQATT